MTPSLVLPLLLAATAATAATASDADLRRCRAMADAQQRLACYDALPLAPEASAATPAQAAANFGIDRSAGEAQAVTSHFPGRFEGWTPNARLRLANGQVWQVVDDSRAFYNLQDPKVTVRRASMGSFMMEIEGARATPRVRRVE